MDDRSLKNKEKEVVALPVWLGTRTYDHSDLSAFTSDWYIYRAFGSFEKIVFPEIDIKVAYNRKYLSRLKEIINRIENMVSKSEYQIAIFLVFSADSLESRWFEPFMKAIEKNSPNCRIYKIIMGGNFNHDKLCDREKAEPYLPHEIRCHEFGAVYSYYNSDAPSNAIHRLIELMNRLMGYDLPDKKFPDYSLGDVKKIAWNVSREDFNTFGKRKDCVPKYKIKDGKPVFTI